MPKKKKYTKIQKYKVSEIKKQVKVTEKTKFDSKIPEDIDKQILEKEKEILRLESLPSPQEVQDNSTRQERFIQTINVPPLQREDNISPNSEIVYNTERNYSSSRPSSNPNEQNERIYSTRNYVSPLDSQRESQSTSNSVKVSLLENPDVNKLNQNTPVRMNFSTQEDEERQYKTSDITSNDKRRRF